MNAPSVNPRRAKYTDRKRQQRAAMGERWRAAEVAAQREAGNRLLGTREAWRRWNASEREFGLAVHQHAT